MDIVAAAVAAMQNDIVLNGRSRIIATMNILHHGPGIAKRDVQNGQNMLTDCLLLWPAAELLGNRVHKGDIHIYIGTNDRFTYRIQRNV